MIKRFLKYWQARLLKEHTTLPFREIYFFGNYAELRKLLVAHIILKEGDIVIDAGAHLGIFSRLFAYYVKNSGKVYSFEPNPYLIKILKRRTKDTKQIKVIHAAVSSKSNENVSLCVTPYTLLENSTVEADLINSKRFLSKTKHVQVVTKCLDDLRKEIGKSVKLIKIDVEGHEESVLNGSKMLIEQDKPVVIFECTPESSMAPFHILTELGYVCMDFKTLEPTFDIPPYNTDILAIHNSLISFYQPSLDALKFLEDKQVSDKFVNSPLY